MTKAKLQEQLDEATAEIVRLRGTLLARHQFVEERMREVRVLKQEKLFLLREAISADKALINYRSRAADALADDLKASSWPDNLALAE